jgi:hypothetical protein
MMRPLYELLPDIAAQETLICLVKGNQDLPSGEYAFVESYCDEPACDCRHVHFIVRRKDSELDWAYIDFGWESATFYAKLCGSSLAAARQLCRPSLCGMKPQSPYALPLLALVSDKIVRPVQKSRLARHYRLFKTALEDEIGAPPARVRTAGRRATPPTRMGDDADA